MKSDTPQRPLRDCALLNFALLVFAVPKQGWAPSLFHIVAGLLIWTFLEYITHRFTFHELWKHPAYKGIEDIHIPHHFEPHDGINAGPLFYFPLSVVLLGINTLICQNLEAGMLLSVGMNFGFMAYEYAHFELHLNPKPNRYFKYMRSFHDLHHDKNWKINFGITSPLWDMVFKTYKHPQ